MHAISMGNHMDLSENKLYRNTQVNARGKAVLMQQPNVEYVLLAVADPGLKIG